MDHLFPIAQSQIILPRFSSEQGIQREKKELPFGPPHTFSDPISEPL